MPSTQTSPNGHRFVFDDFEVDAANRLVMRQGVEVRLTAKVFDILLVFLENPGRLLEKDELIKRVWQEEFVEEGNLARNVSTLRKALRDTGREHKYIATVQGRGYRFIADIKQDNDGQFLSADDRGVDLNPEETYNYPTLTSPGRRRFLLWTIVGVIIVAGGLGALEIRSGGENQKRGLRFENVRLTKLTQSGDVYAPQISRDGQYITYISLTDNAYGISVRQIATGTVLRLLPNKPRIAIWALAIAPDNGFLYYILKNEDSDRANLYRMPLLGGAPFKVAEFADGGLTISPDGKQVAFVRVDRSARCSSIVVVNNDGINERVVNPIKFESLYFSLDWSPDGKSFAAAIKRSESGHEYWYIAELPIEGGPERPVGDRSDFRIIRAQWLPDKSGLVENAVDPVSKQPQIYLLSYPNGVRKRLTNDLNYYQGISMSADGRTIIASQYESSRQVWKITNGADPAQVSQLTTGPQKHFDAVDWVGDEFLVFDEDESSSQSNYNIWRMRADGSEKQQLTFGIGDNSDPIVSPDGNYIVFASNRSGKNELWRMDINGGKLVQLTNIEYQPSLPQFTPDGKSILFLASIGGRFPLWKVSADGGEPTQLLDEDIYHWTISPEGNRIAYSTFDKNAHTVRTRIYSFVTNQTEDVLDIAPETWMRWSNDGQSIYFNTKEDGAKNIWQLNLKTQKRVPVTKFTDQQVFRFYWSQTGNTLACIRQAGTFDAVLLRAE
jgi:Tol biopolymer transport system component/DNA-binding winged helix-turn-helix (wHTH) protein